MPGQVPEQHVINSVQNSDVVAAGFPPGAYESLQFLSFAPLRGFVNASTLYAKMISNGIFENIGETFSSFQRNKIILQENNTKENAQEMLDTVSETLENLKLSTIYKYTMERLKSATYNSKLLINFNASGCLVRIYFMCKILTVKQERKKT